IVADIAGIDEDGGRLQAGDLGKRLIDIVLGAGGGLGDDPVVAAALDAHGEGVRLELRKEVDGTAAALQGGRQRGAAGPPFGGAAGRPPALSSGPAVRSRSDWSHRRAE